MSELYILLLIAGYILIGKLMFRAIVLTHYSTMLNLTNKSSDHNIVATFVGCQKFADSAKNVNILMAYLWPLTLSVYIVSSVIYAIFSSLIIKESK